MKHSEKVKDNFIDPESELKASSAEIYDGEPRSKKPELRLELQLKQRNKKEIREDDN